jgi:hypothetical protein
MWAHQKDKSSRAPPGAVSEAQFGTPDPIRKPGRGCRQTCFVDNIDLFVNEVAISWNAALAWYLSSTISPTKSNRTKTRPVAGLGLLRNKVSGARVVLSAPVRPADDDTSLAAAQPREPQAATRRGRGCRRW